MTLKKLRQQIDAIDAEIIPLLEARMRLVTKVSELKKTERLSVLDSNREKGLLENVSEQIQNPQYKETIIRTYEDLLKHSRAYQENKNR